MSTPNLLSDTKPIPITYTKSYHGFSEPPNSNNRYLFCLELGMSDKSIKNFNKIENKKYSYIVEIDDNIKFQQIESFNIYVSEIPFVGNNYSMFGKIDHDYSTFTQKDENFYIEFSTNNNKDTICTCYFTGVDFDTMFVSPPN